MGACRGKGSHSGVRCACRSRDLIIGHLRIVKLHASSATCGSHRSGSLEASGVRVARRAHGVQDGVDAAPSPVTRTSSGDGRITIAEVGGALTATSSPARRGRSRRRRCTRRRSGKVDVGMTSPATSGRVVSGVSGRAAEGVRPERVDEFGEWQVPSATSRRGRCASCALHQGRFTVRAD